MAKKTKKQKLAQQANERNACFQVSHIQKQVKVLHVSQGSNLASRTLQHDGKASKMNLLLRDSNSGLPLFMRISPTSFQYFGSKRSQQLPETQGNNPSSCYQGKLELGIYHSIGHSYLGFTDDNKKPKTGKEATELLKWARDHSKDHLLAINTLLPGEWKHHMETREGKKETFIKKIFNRQADLLSPWWTTVTFFDSFTSQPHTNDADHPPSFLFNFGAPCFLVLHNYNIKVQLDPLDIAIFNTHTLNHSKEAMEGDSGGLPSPPPPPPPPQLGKQLLDSVMGKEEEQSRVRGANK
ncbi:conserved hypothetical protein [Sporisorium reilianum SRZ2]|uniref:Uncharacterized protein n=1 Tax=Sporisorium reilianum (strain SRZ2) TaxID=999809 RepID=E6ZZ74_SPORE|nr:conserved hypothetical protein [Sporisorium reilianum SRZ2]